MKYKARKFVVAFRRKLEGKFGRNPWKYFEKFFRKCRTIDTSNNWRKHFLKLVNTKEKIRLFSSMTDYFCITIFMLERLPRKREGIKSFSINNSLRLCRQKNSFNISPLSFVPDKNFFIICFHFSRFFCCEWKKSF